MSWKFEGVIYQAVIGALNATLFHLEAAGSLIFGDTCLSIQGHEKISGEKMVSW